MIAWRQRPLPTGVNTIPARSRIATATSGRAEPRELDTAVWSRLEDDWRGTGRTRHRRPWFELSYFIRTWMHVPPSSRCVAAPPPREAQRDIERARATPRDRQLQAYSMSCTHARLRTRRAAALAEERALQVVLAHDRTPAASPASSTASETTRAPEQWAAIKKALGNDRRRIERPSAHARRGEARAFAFDQTIHAEAQAGPVSSDPASSPGECPDATVRSQSSRYRRRSDDGESQDRRLSPHVLRPATEPDLKAPVDPG